MPRRFSVIARFAHLALLLALVACQAPAQEPTSSVDIPPEASQTSVLTPEPTVQTDNLRWWEGRIFYEIFVRSFFDSDGNGIGDFNGITARLDYLEQLGIGGIWLMPIHPSPSYHGYDVDDYYAVNPDYGTLADFRNLLAEAGRRDIRIIIDLVMNHTSVENPWFEDARRGADSAKRDWYLWASERPAFKGPLGSEAWHPSGDGSYYYGIFWSGMPDLNFDNPEVREEFKRIAAFWLTEVGVDGFRLDAARYMVESDLMAEERKLEDSQANHEWLQEFRAACVAARPDAFLVGEIWTSNTTVAKYLQPGELDLAFNFDLASAILKQVNAGLGRQLNGTIDSNQKRFKDGGSATFLTNHDQNRVMSQFMEDEGKARAAAAVLLTMPGTPFIYYGEEIGMLGTKPDERLRRPMQWSAEEHAGFSTRNPWESPEMHYKTRNVALMEADAGSLLEHYRTLAGLRNAHPALNKGAYLELDTNKSGLLAFLRSSGDENILVLINLSGKELEGFTLASPASPLKAVVGVEALYGASSVESLQVGEDGGFNDYRPLPVLAPYQTVLLRLSE